MNQILEQLGTYGIVPVVVLQDAAKAEPLAEALCKGGLACAEVTFRTDAAEESIRIMSEKFPEMLVGAGTVLTIEQADRAVKAGAKFIVSPGLNPEVVKWCQALWLLQSPDKTMCLQFPDIPAVSDSSKMVPGTRSTSNPGHRDSDGDGAGNRSWAHHGEILPGRTGRRTEIHPCHRSTVHHDEIHADRRHQPAECKRIPGIRPHRSMRRKLDGKKYDD